MGGMSAFIPNRREPEVTENALAKVREDKEREATDGFDGTWVAHPDLVPVAMEIFDQALGERLLDILSRRAFRLATWDKLGMVESIPDAAGPHLRRVLSLVDPAAIRQKRTKVVLDCNHGSGSILGPRLLEQLGCDVEVLGATPDGKFEHVPEPLEQNLKGLCEEVKRRGADVGFAQDPDADRLAIVDNTGRYIGEELTLALCADYVLARNPGPVVVNGSTSRTTADVAAKYGCQFHRSYVGEAHVAAKMRAVGAIIGGEGNGGLIEPRVGYVRDSFTAMAYVLAGLSARHRPLSNWVDSLPRYSLDVAVPVWERSTAQFYRALIARAEREQSLASKGAE
jgi:phosphomannomutase